MRPVISLKSVGLTIAALVCVSGCFAACSKASSGPEVAKDAVAGKVTAVTGTVTAEGVLSEGPRALGLDAPIYRDDKISTAAGASVTIVLAHNDARWEIGEGQTHTVSKSVAWRAPKGTSGDSLDTKVNDTTAAAGRHSEREAAQGGSTAMANSPTDDKGGPQEPEIADPPEPVRAPSKATSKATSRSPKPRPSRSSSARRPSKVSSKTSESPAAGGQGAAGAESAISMDKSQGVRGGTSLGSAQPPAPAPAPAPVRPSDSPSKSAKSAAPKSKVSRGAVVPSTLIKQALRSCYVLGDLTGKGKASVTVKFDSSGKITKASVQAPSSLAGLVACTERKLRGKTIDTSKAGSASASASFN